MNESAVGHHPNPILINMSVHFSPSSGSIWSWRRRPGTLWWGSWPSRTRGGRSARTTGWWRPTRSGCHDLRLQWVLWPCHWSCSCWGYKWRSCSPGLRLTWRSARSCTSQPDKKVWYIFVWLWGNSFTAQQILTFGNTSHIGLTVELRILSSTGSLKINQLETRNNLVIHNTCNTCKCLCHSQSIGDGGRYVLPLS